MQFRARESDDMSKGKRVRAVRKGETEPQASAQGEARHEDEAPSAETGSEDAHEVLSAEEAQAREASNDDPATARPQFEVAGENAQEVVSKLKTQVTYWLDRGRYSKVRIKRNGKQLGPDIPVAALLALEAATFFGTGILRGALMHAVGRVFFEVELINEAEEIHVQGVALFLGGELQGARDCFEKAITVDPRYAPAHLQMGVLCKVQNEEAAARTFFETAKTLDPDGQTGQEAQAHLSKMAADD